MPGVLETVVATTTLNRAADAREIASAVVFLSSPDASHVNGAVLHATGGQRAAGTLLLSWSASNS